jgi:hypothetical protein
MASGELRLRQSLKQEVCQTNSSYFTGLWLNAQHVHVQGNKAVESRAAAAPFRIDTRKLYQVIVARAE